MRSTRSHAAAMGAFCSYLSLSSASCDASVRGGGHAETASGGKEGSAAAVWSQRLLRVCMGTTDSKLAFAATIAGHGCDAHAVCPWRRNPCGAIYRVCARGQGSHQLRHPAKQQHCCDWLVASALWRADTQALSRALQWRAVCTWCQRQWRGGRFQLQGTCDDAYDFTYGGHCDKRSA
ncbi:hypothetical protein JKP88DRAFT_219295 [Tribonema minus]|uniref:Uncharacterized protein n=1 Tax=Tribonema minus TaxID=303371 RepID=A0A836CG58_9STRA|nr:hypothetical protein JKP88DRAFT_219295 [Tribonema minus]